MDYAELKSLASNMHIGGGLVAERDNNLQGFGRISREVHLLFWDAVVYDPAREVAAFIRHIHGRGYTAFIFIGLSHRDFGAMLTAIGLVGMDDHLDAAFYGDPQQEIAFTKLNEPVREVTRPSDVMRFLPDGGYGE